MVLMGAKRTIKKSGETKMKVANIVQNNDTNLVYGVTEAEKDFYTVVNATVVVAEATRLSCPLGETPGDSRHRERMDVY